MRSAVEHVFGSSEAVTHSYAGSQRCMVLDEEKRCWEKGMHLGVAA